MTPESVSIDCLNDWLQKVCKGAGDQLELFIERMIQYFVIEIPDEVDQALLV
jgi:hypothetical protein